MKEDFCPDIWLIVGLGNPGSFYSTTRHNIGYMVADALLMEGAVWGATDNSYESSSARISPVKVMPMIKPLTFMNASGFAVMLAARHWWVHPSQIVVIHDDLDLPYGTVRIKVGGGNGGHRGVKSIIEDLESNEFVRVKLGVGRPPEGVKVIDYVLSPFLSEEQAALPELINKGAEAVKLIIEKGVSIAQNTLNRK